MITVGDKDRMLAYLIAQKSERVEADVDSVFPDGNVLPFEFMLICEQFQRKGLVRCLQRLSPYHATMLVTAEAYDFSNHGGFLAQEQILTANLEKLGHELDVLAKSSDPDVIRRIGAITSISADIVSVLGLFR